MTIKTPSIRLPFWRQLRWNLIFYFVVLAIIPIVALTIIRFNQETQRSEEDAYSELAIAVELKQDQLRRWLDDSNAGLRLVASVESPRLLLASPDDAALQVRVNNFLRQSVESYPNFEEFFVYTDTGQVIAASNSNQVGKVVTRQPYFTASLQSNYIQPPYYDLSTSTLTIIITYPLLDENNQTLGVLAGRLNPQTLTTVMTGSRELGETGETYLVSRENNYFLTPSRFEGYELTRAYHSLAIDRALNGENGQAAFDDYRNPPVPVFGVYRWVPELQVGLIAQIDREEALRDAVNARNTSLIIAGVAIVLAAVAGAYFATRVSRPITQLTETAARLARGDFEHRTTITQAGEVGVLGETFNLMADQIQDMVANLENRVTERTKDLQATLEVGRIATSIAASHELLPRLVEAIRDQFNLYYTQIYLIDEVGRFAVLRAGTGTVGQRLLKQKHRLNLSETSIVARTVQTAQPVLVENTETSTIHLPNPLLPDTRSEVAFPLSVAGKILGVLDMQATQPGTFNEANVPVFEAMATTLAGVLQSNAAFEEAQAAISRADAVNRRLVRQNWEGYLGRVAQGKKVGYQYDLEAPTPLDEWTTLPDEATKDEDKAHAIMPIKLGEQKIGNILVTEEWQRDWAPEEIALIEDVAQRVAQAVEQLRAFDETETLANELAIVAEVSTRIASTLDPDELLQSVADVTKESFNLYHAHIYLLDSTGHSLVLAAGAGDVGRRMVDARHAIALNRENSLVARAARSRQVVISNNVTQEPDFLPNPLLPATKSELAAPIVVGNELLGVLDVQADVFNRFTDKDIQVNSTLAGQLAIALANARQFQAVERARQETERLYNSSIDMLGSANFAGYFVSLNPAWEQTLGYTRDELMAQPFIEFVHPDDVAITNAEAARIAEGAKALSFINRYLAKDGSYRWIAWNAAPDMETSLIHFVARDITTQVEAEANLRKLSSAVEQSPSVVMITDTNGVIEYVNPAFTRITGYPPEAAIGQNPRLLKSDQTPAYRYRDMWNAILAGKEWRTEILNKRQNGELYWAELSIAPVKDSQGKITHFLGIHNDITERKQSEEALRQARAEAEVLYLVSSLINEAQNEQGIVDAVARYALADEISAVTLSINDDVKNPTSSLVAADWRRDNNPSLVGLRVPTSDFLFLESLDRREVFYSSNVNEDARLDPQSRQALAAFGVVGLFFVPLIVGDQVLGTLSLSTDKPYQFSERDVRIFRAIAEQAAVTMERIELLKQTQKRAIELQVVAEVTAVAASTLNRTELLQTFSDLTRDSFNLYHAHVYLMNDTGDSLVLAAGSGTIGRQMAGYGHSIPLRREHSLVARAARTGQAVVSNDVSLETDFLPNPLLPDTRSEMALPIVTGDKILGVLDVQSDLVNRFNPEDVQVFTTLAAQIGVAISHAELYEDQLETAERLREVDKLKSEFLASMSHELRTPLNSIIGYAEVILDGMDGPLGDEMREDVAAIHGSGKLLLSLINDILDLAKIEAGQMELEYEEIDLIQFMEKTIETSQIMVKDKPVELRLNVHDEASIPRTIQADPIRLQQIVNNLMSNAAKFTEEGSITVHLSTEDSFLRVAVEDTGMGIQADKLDVVFERFRQADQSSTRRKGGTGLGLDVTRRLVHMHGGQIWVESEYGIGSTFIFTLPITRPIAHPHDDRKTGALQQERLN